MNKLLYTVEYKKNNKNYVKQIKAFNALIAIKQIEASNKQIKKLKIIPNPELQDINFEYITSEGLYPDYAKLELKN
jgi:hypothetical protein